jgi:hypothetical protein
MRDGAAADKGDMPADTRDVLRDVEGKTRGKELANRRFDREEMGALLRLFSALGVTVAVGIVGFFLLGLWVDGQLRDMGWRTYGLPRLGGILAGLGVTVYWAYLRIFKHLQKFETPLDDGGKAARMTHDDRP